MCTVSETLEVHVDYGDRVWEVKLTPGKGRGVFATRDIKKGRPILVEQPLFSVQLPDPVPGIGYDMATMDQDVMEQYLRLEPQDQEEFDSCHEHRFEHDSQDEAGRVMAILRSNGYTTQGPNGQTVVAMYPKVSLINHSCEPNVLNPGTDIKRITAARDIHAGEEVNPAQPPTLPRKEKRATRNRPC